MRSRWKRGANILPESEYDFFTGKPIHIGKLAWAIMHSTADLLAYSCTDCGDAEGAVIFLHDIINLKLGKPVFDKKNFAKWAKIVSQGAKFSEEDSEEEDLTETEPVPDDDERAPDEPATPFVVALLHTAHP